MWSNILQQKYYIIFLMLNQQQYSEVTHQSINVYSQFTGFVRLNFLAILSHNFVKAVFSVYLIISVAFFNYSISWKSSKKSVISVLLSQNLPRSHLNLGFFCGWFKNTISITFIFESDIYFLLSFILGWMQYLFSF